MQRPLPEPRAPHVAFELIGELFLDLEEVDLAAVGEAVAALGLAMLPAATSSPGTT